MTTTATLTEQYVLSILSQEAEGTEFPILFDDVWQDAGYTHKHHAVRFLTERCDAEEGVDFIVLPERVQTPQGGRFSNSIRLTSDGYEFFLSRSNTPQGKANLRCLIQIKRAYLRQLELRLAAPVQDRTELEALRAENSELKAKLAKCKDLVKVLKAECHKTISFVYKYMDAYEVDSSCHDEYELYHKEAMVKALYRINKAVQNFLDR